MKVLLLEEEKIVPLLLPHAIKGNFSVVDSNKKNIVNIEAIENEWVIKSNKEIQIFRGNDQVTSFILKENDFCVLKNSEKDKKYILFSVPAYDETFKELFIKNVSEFTIGNNNKNINNAVKSDISFDINEIATNQLQIIKQDNSYMVKNLDPRINMYINNVQKKEAILETGDVVFIMGIKLFIVKNILVINNPNDTLLFNNTKFEKRKKIAYNLDEDMKEVPVTKQLPEKALFFRPPRIETNVFEREITIDPPPAPIIPEDMPLLYTFGPMVVMGMVSIVTGTTALIRVFNKEQTVLSALPSLVICFSMLMGTILFPALQRKYRKKQQIKKEAKRKEKYTKYLQDQKKLILEEILDQEQKLNKKFVPFSECMEIILKQKPNLWERRINSEDFLELRIGIGNRNSYINISSQKETFSLEDDTLRDDLKEVINESKILKNVPITKNFSTDRISAILGNENKYNFIEGLILQMFAYHGYDDLKLIILTDKDNDKKWNHYKNTPYLWNDEKNFRFFGTNVEEYTQISNYFDEILIQRGEDSKDQKKDYKDYRPYYLIITDCIEDARKIEFIKKILKQDANLGFSIVALTDDINKLPSEFKSIIDLTKEEKNSGISYEYFNQNLQFCLLKLSNIFLEFTFLHKLPNMVTFLEMYNVGNVEQLNSINKWSTNNPSISLQAPIGINEDGDLFNLDLHEKIHGPHGLIAGMTGSGKSELIITYILSMAVNFSPNEVAFVIIDYKGGGLAGSFENRETGMRLPHLVGTITNLDEKDMNRGLVSIQSELSRRQALFNKVRNELSENTMDIYKYQKLYREKKINEPLPHLFIICDEFAELKTQQPDFMEQLISAARIGRSLGVHLILATQKPAGIVNDQIWSNSKFKICLKVQEKADSMDLINKPDAASLKQIGRFYLLVGYNDYFAIGQSAWSGAQYYENEHRIDKIDNNINVVDNVGNVLKSVMVGNEINYGVHKGEELSNIINYLIENAQNEKIISRQLWLPKIPDIIYLDKLRKKYNYAPTPFLINPAIGEFDDPSSQRQGLVTLNLNRDGNTIIYGFQKSGKELLLSTIVYSTTIDHTSEEVNFYILDFGSESLNNFRNFPQVANVILSTEQEKIENLLKMIQKEINFRKKEFIDYNGSYDNYCKNSGKKLPLNIVIINNYEGFQELYDEYEEQMIKLTREGQKYGIIFIVTTNSINGIRYKLSQNFKNSISLQLADRYDYNTIFGNINGLYPATIIGRGLIKMEKVYEFQTAYVCKEEDFSMYMEKVAKVLNKVTSKMAKKIPILPDIVTYEYVSSKLQYLSSIPIGIRKDNLDVETINLEDNGILVSSIETNVMKNFCYSLMNELAQDNIVNYIFDAEKLLKTTDFSQNYINNNFEIEIKKILDFVIKIKDNKDYVNKMPKILITIVGLDKLLKNLNEEGKEHLVSLFKESTLLNKFNYIIFENALRLRDYEYEDWYKKIITNINGIWLGNSINQQSSIKINSFDRSLNEMLESGFGYSIKNGIPALIKTINFEGDDNNE